MNQTSLLERATAILGRLSEDDLAFAEAWLAHLERGRGEVTGPFVRLLGMHFTKFEEGLCSAEMAIGPEMWNPVGVLHGSVAHALIDTTMGGAVASLIGPKRQASIEVKINYLRAVKEGRLVAESWVVRRGRRIWFLEGKVTDEAGELVATGSASYYVEG